MLKDLFKAIPLQTGNLAEGFVMAKIFKYLEYKRYAPIVNAFRLDKKTFELTVNRIDLFSQPIISLDKILEELKIIHLPNPLKVYKDMPISSLLTEPIQNKELEEIRNQLRHYSKSGNDTVSISIDNVDYSIEVDKSVDNFISYFLYEPEEYIKFKNELSKELLNICYEWNKGEYSRLLRRMEEVEKYSKSESAEKTIKYLDEVRFRFDEWFREHNYDLNKLNKANDKKEVDINDMVNQELNNQLRIANDKLKLYNKKVKYAKIDFNKFNYSEVLKAVEKSKKKNGAINYSGVARELGLINHHTAKKICDYFNIKY